MLLHLIQLPEAVRPSVRLAERSGTECYGTAGLRRSSGIFVFVLDTRQEVGWLSGYMGSWVAGHPSSFKDLS